MVRHVRRRAHKRDIGIVSRIEKHVLHVDGPVGADQKVLPGNLPAQDSRIEVHDGVVVVCSQSEVMHSCTFHDFSSRSQYQLGLWRILCIAQIEHKRISKYAMVANRTRTQERVSSCSSSLYTMRPSSWSLCVA